MTITVLVADDQPVVRAGLVMLLTAEPDITVVAEASNGHDAVELARSRHPDIVLMDLRMPHLDGISATRILTQDDTGADRDRLTKVLVLTTFDDDDAVYGALRAGASGFLLKHAAPHDLTAAIRKIAEGEAWIDPAVAGKVIDAIVRLPHPSGKNPDLIAGLTPREREVMILIAEGLSNNEIADRLVLSLATVKTHVARVVMKTGSRDRAQAVVLAYRSGLVIAPHLHS
jgi:DNA-binding NarL/FixJ family response regulator